MIRSMISHRYIIIIVFICSLFSATTYTQSPAIMQTEDVNLILSKDQSRQLDLRSDSAYAVQMMFEVAETESRFEISIKNIREDKVVLALDNEKLKRYNHYTCFLIPTVYEVSINTEAELDVRINEVIRLYKRKSNRTQCGPTDDRVLSSDDRIGRVSPVGCTGQLLANGVVTLSGHCFDDNNGNYNFPANSFLEFNVPLSNANGSNNPADPEDQYPVDISSIVWNNDGCGKDYGMFRVEDNAMTNLSPYQAQGDFFRATNAGPSTSFDIRITGYGNDFDDLTFDNVQQTHTGDNNGLSTVNGDGKIISYEADTEGGNSGSPIQRLGNAGFSYGIHNNGGCGGNGCSGNGDNSGISYTYEPLEDALNDFYGSSTVHVDKVSNSGIEIGTLFAPFDTFLEGVNVSSNTIQNQLLVVDGVYNEANNTVIDKPLLIRSPAAGSAIIR